MSNEKHYPLHPGQTQPPPYYTQVPTEEYEALKREVQQLRELTAGNRTTIDDVVEINTLTSEVKALREMNAKAQEEITKLKSENESLEYSVATLDTDLAMERRWRKFPKEKPHENESIVLVAFVSKIDPTIYTIREAVYSEGLEEFFNPMDHTESLDINGNSCDLVYENGNQVFCIEAKLHFNFEVLAQACRWRELATASFIAVPSTTIYDIFHSPKKTVLNELDIGLILVYDDKANFPLREFDPFDTEKKWFCSNLLMRPADWEFWKPLFERIGKNETLEDILKREG